MVLLPLALSRTQDDKGRLRWTLFGGSEQGPARPFWRGFFTAPEVEGPEPAGIGFLGSLLKTVYGETAAAPAELLAAGFRILPAGEPLIGHWDEGPLPGWGRAVRPRREAIRRERPVPAHLPAVRPAPGPGPAGVPGGAPPPPPLPRQPRLLGAPVYHHLRGALPLAMQIPLLHTIVRHNAPTGLRVPQEGFFRVRAPGPVTAGPVVDAFRRTNRWDRIYRDQDELAELPRADEPLLKALFSTTPADVDLYDKPQARNVQLWTPDGRLLLDGPRATAEQVRAAWRVAEAGGVFGYRFLYPAMRVGRHEVYWHRPLAAYRRPRGGRP